MRRSRFGIFGVLLAGSLLFSGSAMSAPIFGQFLTGSSGGVYDIIGSAMVDVINKNVEGVRLNPSNPPSYSKTPPAVNSGAAIFGLSDADQFRKAHGGLDEFKKPLSNLRVVMSVYSNVMSQVALEKSGIRTLADVKGKRVAVPSVTTRNLVAQMYEFAGVSADDIKWVYLTYAESADALKDGNVDVAAFTAYPKNGTVESIATVEKIRFLELDQAVIDKWNAANPQARIGEIPAGTYPGVDVTGKFYALYTIVIANEKTDAATIAKVVAAIFEHKNDIAAVHPAGKEINPDSLLKQLETGILDARLLHPGTVEYYRSIGKPIPGAN